MSIINLKNYKLAKEYKDDSSDILKVIDLSIRGLQGFNKYKPVMHLLGDLKNTKALLEAHLKTADKILGEKK